MTFKDYLKTQYHYNEKSLIIKEKIILDWQKSGSNCQNLNYLTQEALFKIIAIRQQKYKAVTLNCQIKTLEQYYYYLLKIGKIKSHPLKDFRIKMPKSALLKDFLSEEELGGIYEKMPSKGHYSGQFDCFAYRKKVIVGLLVYQGLRSSDLGEINLENIDLEKGMIEIPKSQSNNLNTRKLPLSPNQILGLHYYITSTRGEIARILKQKESSKLFLFSEKIEVKSLTKGIKKSINKHSALNDLLQIRYSRIALWLKVYNPRETQYRAGYKSLLSLEKYRQNELESLKQAIEKYHTF